MKHFSPEILS